MIVSGRGSRIGKNLEHAIEHDELLGGLTNNTDEAVNACCVRTRCRCGDGDQKRIFVCRSGKACGGCSVFAEVIGQSPFACRIVR